MKAFLLDNNLAVTYAPPVLTILLNRFDNERSPATKNTRKVSFGKSLTFGSKEYQLRALVLHSGDTLEKGHFTAAIHHIASGVHAGREDSFFLADDDSPLKSLSWVSLEKSVFLASYG